MKSLKKGDIDKENFTVFERPLKGYSAETLLNIIIGNQVSQSLICQKVPRGIRRHAAYIVDQNALRGDILSFGDDNGSWGKHTKPRRKYKVEVSQQLGVQRIKPFQSDEDGGRDPEDVYTLYRNYFTHVHTPQFRKVIATVGDRDGSTMPLAVVQYYFEEGIEVPVKLKKHGNAKDEDAGPYLRTSRPVLKALEEKCKTKSCRKAVDECFKEGGGTIGCRSVADVPRDRQQAYNVKKKVQQEVQRHEFYDVLELLNDGTFVRDFAFGKSSSTERTQPRSFQATRFQLQELSRLCQTQKFPAVLSIDATFNCGSFYVTLTSFANKMFVNKQGKHPAMIGPSILHTTKEFEDYHYLIKQLKVHCKCFECLQAFGTDGETNISNAGACELPEAIHVRCKIHICDNIEEKLKNLSFGKSARGEIINTIFGRRLGEERVKGLADAESADDFDSMLEDVKEDWDRVESTQRSGKPKFHEWFKMRLGQVFKENVIAPIRQIAGLGSPPEFYTQNVAECVNMIIKADAGRKMGWADFCRSLQETVERQEREWKKAVHQMGEYRLSPQFKHLEVRSDKWIAMTIAQKEAHLKKVFEKPLDKLGRSCEGDIEVEEDDTHISNLSVAYEDCGITTVSRSNLKAMWIAATRILEQTQGVLQVPWDVSGTQRLVFNGTNTPPCNVFVNGDQVKCVCAKYKSAQFCEHSLAVAEQQMRLAAFLRIVRKKKNLPNPEKLISDNISSSAGQKSGGRRKGKPNECKPALMTIRERTTTTTTSTCTTTSATESAFTTCDSNAVKATGGSAFSDSAAAAALLALSGGAVQCNNFTLKCLSGTQVRMCYGCGSSIRTPPQVPDPPHDYCIVNREYRAYKAPDGTTKVGNEPQNCHYHLRMSCVRRKHSDFGLGVLRIPLSLREKLSVKHWSWLDHEFGVLDLSHV